MQYNDFKSLIPIRTNKEEDYRDCINRSISDYCSLLRESKENIDVIDSCKSICQQLIEIIDNTRIGLHSKAYKQLENILNNKNNKYGFDINEMISKEEGCFYRMRKMEDRHDVRPEDLFHIPFTQRSKVKTERFSFPGLPCLYLGSSIYVCWEEMGRPEFSRIMVAALKSQRKLNLLDLRVPNNTRLRTINKKVIPLILACQVEVPEKKASYKSEYIIPQLIMEYIISSKNNVFDGIVYTTVFHDKRFNYPTDKLYNIALPAIQQKDNEQYSRRLMDLFLITQPTCEEFERLNRHIGVSDISETIYRTNVEQNRNYEISIFREMEKSLENPSLFSYQPLEIKE